MEKNKAPFYKMVIASIKNFDKYQDFATEDLKSGIKYFIKLVLLMSVIISIAITIKGGQTMNKTIDYLRGNCPNFKFENSMLSVESDEGLMYEGIEEFEGIIIVDTRSDISQETLEKYNKKIELYNNSIFIQKDKITMKNELLEGEVTQTYKELQERYKIDYFDKEQIIGYFTTGNLIRIYISMFISLVIVFFMIYVFELLISAIGVMIFGYFTGMILGLKLKATNIFNITVHSMTLSLILRILYVIVNLFTGFYIKYFDFMYITLILIYVITALWIIRLTLIKQQIELTKIVEEQKKIKEELQDNEEQPEEKQSEEKEGKKQDEKEDDKDNNIGKEVEGEV